MKNSRVLNSIRGTHDIAAMFKTIIDYYQTKQEEMTKREQIRADRDVALQEIKSKEKAILKYLDEAYKERKKLFKNYFERIDKAMEANNVEMLGDMVQGLVKTYKESPFAALASIKDTREQLLQGDVEVEL